MLSKWKVTFVSKQTIDQANVRQSNIVTANGRLTLLKLAENGAKEVPYTI